MPSECIVLRRRSLIQIEGGMVLSAILDPTLSTKASRPLTQATTPASDELVLAEEPYTTDWLGVSLSISNIPELWLPREIEDHGIRKLILAGEDHPYIEFYFDSGFGVSPEIVAESRKVALEVIRGEDVLFSDIPINPGDTVVGGLDALSIVTKIPGSEPGTIAGFSGTYMNIDDSGCVLCVELLTNGNVTIFPREGMVTCPHCLVQPL